MPGAIIVAAGYGVALYRRTSSSPAARAACCPWTWPIRAGACLLILGAIAHASRQMARLPHVFSAVAQETLLIYFVHLCVIYGSAWSYGLVQRLGAALDPGDTAGRGAWRWCAAMAAMAATGTG